MQNKSLIFKKVPTGYPQAGEHLAIEDRPLDLDARPPDDALLVQNLYFSFDPYLRGRMRPANVESYSPAFLIDQPIRNSAISKVLKSANPKYQEGDPIAIYMSGYFQQYTLLSSEDVHNNVWKLDNPFNLDPVNFLGPLGMPGLTAYSFLYEIAEPKKGETIYISAASGAVGSMVGQLAKREGLTVIGSVGSDDKLDYILEELNFDEGFNYKEESPFEALKRLAPNGIDIYFENVGGNQLEAALDSLNLWGRVVVCGMIADYNKPFEDKYGVKNLQVIFEKRLKIQGCIVADLQDKYYDSHQKDVQRWLKDGSLQARVSTTVGMDNAIEGLLSVFSGKNFGKAVLQVSED